MFPYPGRAGFRREKGRGSSVAGRRGTAHGRTAGPGGRGAEGPRRIRRRHVRSKSTGPVHRRLCPIGAVRVDWKARQRQVHATVPAASKCHRPGLPGLRILRGTVGLALQAVGHATGRWGRAYRAEAGPGVREAVLLHAEGDRGPDRRLVEGEVFPVRQPGGRCWGRGQHHFRVRVCRSPVRLLCISCGQPDDRPVQRPER